MASVAIAPAARAQLAAIRQQRRAQAGVAAAERLDAAIGRFLATVSAFPRIGIVTHRIDDFEFRVFPINEFAVRFRVRENGDVTIADVRHGAMQEAPLDQLEQQANEGETE